MDCMHESRRLEGSDGKHYKYRCMKCGVFLLEPKNSIHEAAIQENYNMEIKKEFQSNMLESAYSQNEMFEMKKRLEKLEKKSLFKRLFGG